MLLTPRTEVDQRIARFQSGLHLAGLDAALISQNADLYYYTGTMQTAQLLVPPAGDPLLMVRRSYERARTESPLPRLAHLGSLRELPALMAGQLSCLPRRLGLELDVLPANTYLVLQRLLPDTELVDVSPAVRAQRAIKSTYEVAIQREAARLIDQVFAVVPRMARQGMTEVALAAELEAEARRLGHPGLVRMRSFNQEIFYGHVLSGDSGAVPSFTDSPTGGTGPGPSMPQGAGDKPLAADEPIFVDLVMILDGLMVDQTRLFALESLPDDLAAAHDGMLVVQREVAAAAKPGVACGDLYDLAHRVASELGLGGNFMGYDENRAQFIGHGVGLELNDLPVLARGNKAVLEPGNVIALEPKCLFPGRGAVGIENTWLVTGTGLERLTITPDELWII